MRYAQKVPSRGCQGRQGTTGSSRHRCRGVSQGTAIKYEAGSMEDPLRIVGLKRKNIPKVAVLAAGLTAAVVAATMNIAPAQAYPCLLYTSPSPRDGLL